MTYIIAEIGLNHNGDLDIAKRLIEEAAKAGADAVKFQKRVPELAVPKDQWDVMRDTPWGEITYLDYKRLMEFSRKAYEEIDQHCREHGIRWSASVWDTESVNFMKQFKVPWIKIPSAKITDDVLIRKVRKEFPDKKILMSTGMSDQDEIVEAIESIGEPLVVMHCNSQYPCPVEDINLTGIYTLDYLGFESEVDFEIGYSGHETGLATTVAAVAMGAEYIERHITLDRAMWGTDQAASVEPQGFQRLVRDIRSVERAMGTGILGVSEGELEPRRKLRGE